ncbi:MAG: hypothetical protein V4534_00585 [Myxococcota bacterium]
MHEEFILSPTEEDLAKSHFRGLLPGQIDYPLGPINESLPFPIFFRFTLSERKILKTHVEIGWLHQGIEKLLEDSSATESIEIVRRINPICPNIIEHFFRISAGLDPVEADTLKAEKIAYHLHFIRQILKFLREDYLLVLLNTNLEHFRTSFLRSKRLKTKLSGIGAISLAEALSYGLTGPSLKACYAPYTGDIWSRLVVKLEETRDPPVDCAPEGDLIFSNLPGRVRIKTPAFAHASALPVFLKNADLDDLTLILLSLGLVGTEIDR